jgi:hypothetical protein
MSGTPRLRDPAPGATGARRDAAPATFPSWARHALALAPALLGSALAFAPALGTFFAADDVTLLSRAAGLESAPWSLGRPLSALLAWRPLYAAFGLEPRPYHAAQLALHLAATTLVYLVGFRLLASRRAAAAAAVLFGISSIAFTPLHWASSLGELMMAVLALAAFLVFLIGRARMRPPLLWAGAVLGVGAMLAKETALLLPVPLLIAAARGGSPPGGEPARSAWRTTLPQVTTALAFAAALLVTRGHLAYPGGEAYAMKFSPAFLALNLSTYLRWCVSLHEPIRDAVAAVEPGAWPVGLLVAGALALLLASQRGADRRPGEVGLAWFLAFLAPVLPLANHTYLYYLYLPWAGACWLLAGVGQRAARRWPGPLTRVLLALAVTAAAAAEFRNVRAREQASAHGLPLDRTMRESRLLGNGVAGLRAAGLAAGDSIAFVNPFSSAHVDIASRETAPRAGPQRSASYIPFEAALRGGESLRLFLPGLRLLGFADSLPPGWSGAKAFFYDNDGTLTPLGSGLEAERRLGALCIQFGRWDLAERAFRRAQARGDTSADAAHGLLLALAGLGRDAEARWLAVTFVRRWPDDPRSAAIEAALRHSTR